MDYCRDFGCWDFAVPDTRFCFTHSQPHQSSSTRESDVRSTPAAVADARARLMDLMKKKDALEAEIQMLSAVSKPGPLVDEQGFPRSDIDVHAERITRSQLARLQTDHVAIMHQIEASLHVLHARTAATPGLAATKPAQTTQGSALVIKCFSLAAFSNETRPNQDLARLSKMLLEHAGICQSR